MKIEGACLVYGDDINTDVIIPSMHCGSTDPQELGKKCFALVDPLFHAKAATAPILLVGKNFGCGSSREHAPLAIKGAGIGCVVGISFARIFFRNAVNIGLPLFECAALVADSVEGDPIVADFAAEQCVNRRSGRTFAIPKYPPAIAEIFRCGGLTAFYRLHCAGRSEAQLARFGS